MYHHALHILIWCTLINYAVLITWFAVFNLAHDWLYSVHSRWFRISVETFDTLNYSLMGIYKIGVILFNLVPLIALHFV